MAGHLDVRVPHGVSFRALFRRSESHDMKHVFVVRDEVPFVLIQYRVRLEDPDRRMVP